MKCCRDAVLADRRMVRRALADEAARNAEWAMLRHDYAGDEAGRSYRSRELGVRDAMTRLNDTWREADRKARKRSATTYRCAGCGEYPSESERFKYGTTLAHHRGHDSHALPCGPVRSARKRSKR